MKSQVDICVQFFVEEQGGGGYSSQKLNELVRGQWLLGDLGEMCAPCLPGGLGGARYTQLTGTYVLQMNYVLDISVSAYQQLQKLTKVDLSNIEATALGQQTQGGEGPSPHRVLRLCLTDGGQEVYGLEYRPMRNLSVDMLPGTKIQIKGPVDCRRGILMLEEKHVTVLGGEVEDLVRENYYKTILTRIVKENANRDPNVAARLGSEISNRNASNRQEHSDVSNRNANRRQEHSEVSNRNANNRQQNEVSNRDTNRIANNTRDRNEVSNTNTKSLRNNRQDWNEVSNTNVNSMRNNRQDWNEVSNSNTNRMSNNRQGAVNDFENDDLDFNNLDSEMFQDDFDMDMLDSIEQNALNNPSTSHPKTPQPAVKKIKISNANGDVAQVVKKFSPKREDLYEAAQQFSRPNDEEDEYLRMMEMEDDNFMDNQPTVKNERPTLTDNISPVRNYPIKVSIKPFVYIKQLVDLGQTDLANKKFTVKGQVISIINKLKFKNGEWDLKCKICDGTSYLDVDVSDEVLSSLVGYTSKEMSKMKHQMAMDSKLKQQVVQGLSNAHQKLQTMDCLLDILYRPSGPCIVAIREYTEEHLDQLERRRCTDV